MRLSCSNTMVQEESLTKKAIFLKRCGFESIAIFLDYEIWSEKQKEEILHLEERTGIIPCEFVLTGKLYGHLMDKNNEVQKKAIDMYKKAAEFCAEIGAVTEMEYEYAPQDPLPLFQPYAHMSLSEEERFLKVYQEILLETKGSRAKVLLEGINRYESPYLNRLEDCVEIVKKTNCENAGVLADFFHMSIEETNICESLEQFAPYISHIHLGDNNRLLPGYGSLLWENAMKVLRKNSYTGFLNLECGISGDVEECLTNTVSFLKGLWKKAETV